LEKAKLERPNTENKLGCLTEQFGETFVLFNNTLSAVYSLVTYHRALLDQSKLIAW
jgi:hypothetical protein